MKLLNSYEDKDAAEIAENKISGPHRLASERDGTEIIYNLFGIPSWNNFYMLEMFELTNLKVIIERKKEGKDYDKLKHNEIVSLLRVVSKNYNIEIPKHWL
ncbi:hypothetical protein [Vibrio cholerae]|uniref:hypothetical protein n=1 Tax=Vibrio cholerae TaxID=666 RepID=UPI00155EE219|nr:hypothetical protein [Vibrio cholerae]NOF43863.1 hypothetical protein [Vibrio cholerae]